MAKKKGFSLTDALGIASDVAGLVGGFKQAQAGVQQAKQSADVRKAFDQGNATNLAASEGARLKGSPYKPKVDMTNQFEGIKRIV